MKNNKIVVLSLFLFVAQFCYSAEQNKSPIEDDFYSQVPIQDYLEIEHFDNLEDDDLLFEFDENNMQTFSQDCDYHLLESLLNDYESEQNGLQSHSIIQEDGNELVVQEQEALGQLQEERFEVNKLAVKRKRKRKNSTSSENIIEESRTLNWSEKPKFNNDLYTHAITKVLEQKKMSMDAFDRLNAQKKTTLLLRLTEKDRNELSVQEQEALAELEEKRSEQQRKIKNITSSFINRKHAHAAQCVIDSGEIDRESFDQLGYYAKSKFVINLTPEQIATLSMQEQKDLEHLKQVAARGTQAKRNYKKKFNNDLYTDAITKVLEEENMSIEVFNELTAQKKTTLLLQLTQEDYNKLPVEEKKALVQLKAKRKKELQLIKERCIKRRLHASVENTVDTPNKKPKNN